MIDLFLKGGPMMWPLLLTSLITVAVVADRLLFIWQERRRRRPQDVEAFFRAVERNQPGEAQEGGAASGDFVARVLAYGLRHRGESLAGALLRAANGELQRFNRGLSTLDTVITLAPLLGLLGTVTGMIHAFALLGNQELSAPAAITGGIAQALIATAFGLGIAILALIPFNYLNARQEEARHELQDAATQLELLLGRQGKE
ncbi:MAG: MotA/TolQ/ExbB proton channel family protein [Verrucomicrobium sp.]|nr:MotA/TolQ/ExbB proton channel family protein [Verrucomicrobium sp.]